MARSGCRRWLPIGRLTNPADGFGKDYYGWTWVSYDPWGWAPYHYGRWFRASYGWGWVPGPIYGRYGYRPALVGFFGYGGGVGIGVGFGFGNLGWVALAPFERFSPWYGRGFAGRGVTNVNIYNTYRNARVPNGAMGMTAQQFQSGQTGRYAHPGAVQLQNGGSIRGQLPITPGSGNLRFNDRTTSVAARVGSSQRFVSRGGFAPVQRQPFSQQRQSFQQNLASPRGVQQGGPQSGRAIGNSGSGNSPSWQRFGTPSSAGASRTSSTAASQANSGWGRFGTPGSGPTASSAGRTQNTTTAPRNNYAPTGSSNRPVQIAPSIVQQRSGASSSAAPARQSAPAAPTTNRSSGSSSGSSGGRSSTGGNHGSAAGGGHHNR